MREAQIHYQVDIPRLARMLAKGFVLVKMNYYTAPTPNQHSEVGRKQQQFFDALRASSSVHLVLGRHEKRGDHHVEKETDVKLSVDMVVGAYEGQYDVAMIVSGDTDYVPAVEAVRRIGKKVIWAHFATQQHSLALRQNVDRQILLEDKLLRTCERKYYRR
jgi:uncharacterized LabA/DUF88 family protein